MKKHIITISIAAAILSGCASQKAETDASEISWQAFCAARGYDPTDNTFPVLNEYLDTWRGSAQEDSILTKIGAEPF